MAFPELSAPVNVSVNPSNPRNSNNTATSNPGDVAYLAGDLCCGCYTPAATAYRSATGCRLYNLVDELQTLQDDECLLFVFSAANLSGRYSGRGADRELVLAVARALEPLREPFAGLSGLQMEEVGESPRSWKAVAGWLV